MARTTIPQRRVGPTSLYPRSPTWTSRATSGVAASVPASADGQRHVPAAHEHPVPQAFPHAPQLFGSAYVCTGTGPTHPARCDGQPTVPGGPSVPQVPLKHQPPQHCTPQAPQFEGSCWRFAPGHARASAASGASTARGTSDGDDASTTSAFEPASRASSTVTASASAAGLASTTTPRSGEDVRSAVASASAASMGAGSDDAQPAHTSDASSSRPAMDMGRRYPACARGQAAVATVLARGVGGGM